MYSEQLAVLLFIAATHATGPGLGVHPMLQPQRSAMEKTGLPVKADLRLHQSGKLRKQIKREREAMMLAEFH